MECIEIFLPNELLVISTDVLWEQSVGRILGWTESEEKSWFKLKFRSEFVGDVFAKGIRWSVNLD